MKIKDFILENYHKRIGFSTENSYYSMKRLKKKDLLLLSNKLVEKLTDPQNAQEHYQSFLQKKNIKSKKQSKIITYQPKNSNIFDINSVITEDVKVTKREDDFKGYASTYKVKFLNSCNFQSRY